MQINQEKVQIWIDDDVDDVDRCISNVKTNDFFITSPTQTTPSTTVVAIRVVVVVVEDKTAFL